VVRGGGLGKQPGSAFKPFVLAAAYEKGFSPGSRPAQMWRRRSASAATMVDPITALRAN
jgi:membrane peptidoglycan carboxypeptidase